MNKSKGKIATIAIANRTTRNTIPPPPITTPNLLTIVTIIIIKGMVVIAITEFLTTSPKRIILIKNLTEDPSDEPRIYLYNIYIDE